MLKLVENRTFAPLYYLKKHGMDVLKKLSRHYQDKDQNITQLNIFIQSIWHYHIINVHETCAHVGL